MFALDGVALGAAVELPFANGQPVFDFGVSSREHPFCLTVAFLGFAASAADLTTITIRSIPPFA